MAVSCGRFLFIWAAVCWLFWALTPAGAFAQSGPSGGAGGTASISIDDLAGLLEAQLPWYSFVPMDERTLDETVGKFGILADAYDITGRVSLDGQYGYVAGVLKPGRNPAAEGLGAVDRTPDCARVFYNADSPGALIVVPAAYAREKGFGLEYDALYGFVTSGDMDSLRDTTRRGVTVSPPLAPYLSVYLLENGRHRYEYIRLTEEDLKKAASDRYTFKPGAIGGAMSLVTSEAQAEYGDGSQSIPASLYLAAAERCGFTIASPKDIGTIVRATPTVSRGGGIRTQTVEDRDALKKLATLLKRAQKTDLGNCPYTAVLTMVMKDGRVLTVQKAIDGCHTLVFGSAMGYEIDAKADKLFRQIFRDASSILPQ